MLTKIVFFLNFCFEGSSVAHWIFKELGVFKNGNIYF